MAQSQLFAAGENLDSLEMNLHMCDSEMTMWDKVEDTKLQMLADLGQHLDRSTYQLVKQVVNKHMGWLAIDLQISEIDTSQSDTSSVLVSDTENGVSLSVKSDYNLVS